MSIEKDEMKDNIKENKYKDIKEKLKQKLKGKKERKKRVYEVVPNPKWYHRSYVIILLVAIFDTLLIELLNHKFFTEGLTGFIDFVSDQPLALLVNFMLLMALLAPAFFLKRRGAWLFLISGITVGVGVANGFIRTHRMTPFTTADLTVVNTGLATLPNYMSTGYIILIVVGFVLAWGIFFWFVFRGPRSKETLKRRLVTGVIALCVIAGGLVGSWNLAMDKGQLSKVFPNLAIAYDNYGFGYCFLQTWLSKGIQEPYGYSEEKVDSILSDLKKSTKKYKDAMEDVNVIYVQLESFIDPGQIKGLKLSESATTNWRRLKREYSHGYLTVPVVGAGTANSELEVLTGMSTRFFGPGEYPYKTCLMDKTFESAAYDLKEHGYATHAIHNHRSAFYSRNIVYSNLGFDDFTGLEYMLNVEKTPNNWCKDQILTDYVLKALDSTPEQSDFVFTVTVQEHGAYPTEESLENPSVTVKECNNEEMKYAYEYWANQVYDTDKFIGELTDALEERDEKTIVVFYGDHLPSLDLTDEDMKSGDIYQTEYVIWDNFGLGKLKKNMYAYQLSSYALGKIGVTNGLFNSFNLFEKNKGYYQFSLKMLQYDILYGENYALDGEEPYEKTDLKMGIDPMPIKLIVEVGDKWVVKGENFTKYCKVTVDGEIIKTKYVNEKTLYIYKEVDMNTQNVAISVLDKNKEVLSIMEQLNENEDM